MAAEDPIKSQFEILRKRARQAAQTATQQEREGLQRRFAAIGQVGSGAQIRAEAQAAERGAKRLAQAEETVGLAELGERQRQQEIAQQRAFATGEREAGQRFAAEQAGIQRQFAAQQAAQGRGFATGEREAGQRFAAEQAGLSRAQQSQLLEAQQKFARGERLSSQDYAALEAQRGREFAGGEREAAQQFAAKQAELGRTFTGQQADLARAIQERALGLQQASFNEGIRRFDLEFARDSDTIEFNKRMAEQAASQTLLDDLGLGGLQQRFGGQQFTQAAGLGALLGIPGAGAAAVGSTIGGALGGLF